MGWRGTLFWKSSDQSTVPCPLRQLLPPRAQKQTLSLEIKLPLGREEVLARGSSNFPPPRILFISPTPPQPRHSVLGQVFLQI